MIPVYLNNHQPSCVLRVVLISKSEDETQPYIRRRARCCRVLTLFSLSLLFPSPFAFVPCFGCGSSCSPPSACPSSPSPPPPVLAWQGTDLMHNHVLADDDQSSLDSLGRRSSLSRVEPSDFSEDSDYDSIWTAHSYRMGSASRKSCCSYISHQN